MSEYFVNSLAYIDLALIEEYIALDSPRQAALVRKEFFAKFRLLADFPEMAPKSTDWIGARRHTGVGKIRNYLIYYWIHEGAIEILRVIHAQRDQADALLDDAE